MLSNQTMELRGEDFDLSTEATDREMYERAREWYK